MVLVKYENNKSCVRLRLVEVDFSSVYGFYQNAGLAPKRGSGNTKYLFRMLDWSQCGSIIDPERFGALINAGRGTGRGCELAIDKSRGGLARKERACRTLQSHRKIDFAACGTG